MNLPVSINSHAPRRFHFGLGPLCVVAVFLGTVTGLGAILFRTLIGFLHNVMFLGRFTAAYDANLHTPASLWGPLVILVPVIGGLGVVFLVTKFAPEARGHGVPEVMDAIFYNDGKIRPVVAIVKSLASALAIGSGAAVGREGPIIQIGSSLGSTAGQVLPMETWQRITLVAAGAGAGIAATFNTPIGGVMFAIELMMPEISVRTFLPVALATGAATFVGRLFLGMKPAFEVPSLFLVDHPTSVSLLILYAVLGAVIGVAATLFIRGLHHTERWFESCKNPYLRHTAGMTVVGILIYAFFLTTGHYHIEGVGYASIQDVLLGDMTVAPLLLILFAGKLIATILSLGSGSSGGIFSPSLFMGAMLGGTFGAVMQHLLPGLDISVATFAIVGMAAMVGGSTGAAMTAVTMIFEMTRDYNIVTPMIVAVALAIGIRRVLSKENIYTIKLVARRHFIPKALHANMFLVRSASDVMDRDINILPSTMHFSDFLKQPEHDGKFRHVVVTDGENIAGVLRVNTALRRGLVGVDARVTLGDIALKSFILADEEDIMFNIIGRLSREKAVMVIVLKSPQGIHRISDISGVIAKEHIADSVAESLRPYADADHNSGNKFPDPPVNI